MCGGGGLGSAVTSYASQQSLPTAHSAEVVRAPHIHVTAVATCTKLWPERLDKGQNGQKKKSSKKRVNCHCDHKILQIECVRLVGLFALAIGHEAFLRSGAAGAGSEGRSSLVYHAERDQDRRSLCKAVHSRGTPTHYFGFSLRTISFMTRGPSSSSSSSLSSSLSTSRPPFPPESSSAASPAKVSTKLIQQGLQSHLLRPQQTTMGHGCGAARERCITQCTVMVCDRIALGSRREGGEGRGHTFSVEGDGTVAGTGAVGGDLARTLRGAR